MDSTARDHFAAEVAALLRAGRTQAALDLLAYRLQCLPEEAEWRLVLAVLQQRAGRPGEAAASLAALRDTRPDDAALEALAVRLSDDDAGRARRRRAAAQLVAEAREAAAEGELGAAVARGRAALAMAPESAEPHALLAELLADAEPHAAQRAADYAACLAVLDDGEPSGEPDEDEAPGPWAEAWRLGMAEWPGWLVLDSTALLVIALPFCIVAAFPLAVWLGVRSGAGGDFAREMLSQTAGPVALATLAAWLWTVLSSCCYGAQRLVVMTGRIVRGQLVGELLRVGSQRFRARWADLSGLVAAASLAAAVLGATVLLSPVAVLMLPLLLIAPALIVLRNEPAGRAVALSARAVQADYGAWVASVAAVSLAVTVLGGLSLLCPTWGVVMALRQPSLAVALLWLLAGLVLHGVFFPLAWTIAHVASFAGLLAYRDIYGDAGFRAVPLALVATDDDELPGPADVRPAGDELGGTVAGESDDREQTGP